MMRVLRAVTILFVTAATARATVVVPADLGELSRDARAIALGRVVAVDGRWTDDRRTIETIVTLEVDRYFKGSLGSTLHFRVPGGEFGRYRTIVVGAPEFAVDQRVVVFLSVAGPMIPYIVGFNQGVYRVVPADQGGEWLVTPPPMLPSAVVSSRVVRGDGSRKPLALGDFEARVRTLAGGGK